MMQAGAGSRGSLAPAEGGIRISIGRICSREVIVAAPDEIVADAAARMDREKVGTLVVTGEDRRPAGILTDRDVALRCVGRGLDPYTVEVSDVMTAPVRTVPEETPIEDTLSLMAAAGNRRLVVTDADDRLVGIVALDDVLDLLIEEAESIGRILREQSPATP